ncbi:EamA family transporter [Saliphagus sp. GCM10025308]
MDLLARRLSAGGRRRVRRLERHPSVRTDGVPVTALEAVALNETAGFVALAAYAMVTQGRAIVDLPRRSAGYYAISGLFTAAAFMALFEALDRGSVSIVDPLYGTAPLFTTVFAYFLLRDVERVTAGIVAGAATIVLGAVLVTTA